MHRMKDTVGNGTWPEPDTCVIDHDVLLPYACHAGELSQQGHEPLRRLVYVVVTVVSFERIVEVDLDGNQLARLVADVARPCVQLKYRNIFSQAFLLSFASASMRMDWSNILSNNA